MDELNSIPGLDITDEPKRTALWLVALAAAGAVVGSALIIASAIAAGGTDGLRAHDFARAVLLLLVLVGVVLSSWYGVVQRVCSDAETWDAGVSARRWQRERDVVLAAARRHPRLHRLQVRGMALFGRLAPVVAMESLWLLVLLALTTVVLVGGALSIVLLLLTAAIATWALQFTRAFRTIARASAADGAIVVTRREGRALHLLVDEVAQLLGARAPHELAIGDGLDVQLRSWPSAWWQLRPRRRLTFGYQLLSSLPVDELRALVTSELGHVAVRTDEARVELASSQAFWIGAWRHLDREQAVSSLICTIAGWFLYRSQRLLLATDRVEDRAADRRVRQLLEPATARRALLRTALLEQRVERAHRDFICDQAAKATPPPGRSRQLVAGLHAPPITTSTAPAQLVRLLLDEIEALRANGLRPSLPERCHGVGAAVLDDRGCLAWPLIRQLAGELTVALPRPASRMLLGDHATTFGDRLDAAWMRRAAPQWRKLVSLAIAGDAGGMQSRATGDADVSGKAVEQATARIFGGNATGWSDLQAALRSAPELIEAAAPALVRYCHGFGDIVLAREIESLALQRSRRVALAQTERAGFSWHDVKLQAGELDAARLRLLHAQLAVMPDVCAAWIVEHRFAALPDEPAWVVTIQLDHDVESADTPSSYDCRRVQERLDEWLTHHLARGVETWMACNASHVPSPLGTRTMAVRGARSWVREGVAAERVGVVAPLRPATKEMGERPVGESSAAA